MNLKNRVVYIAGPITGRLDTYKQEFAEAEKHLADQGAVVLNPAVLPIGLKSHQSYMNICLPMLREAEVLVLLPGWRHSKGAMAEYEEAGRLGIVSYPFQPIATGPLSVDEPANDNVPASEREDDLTWLVRETKGEWFGNSTHIARDGLDDYLWANEPRLPDEYHWFTKAQYLTRKAELQNKPSWADAPEWAEWLCQSDDGMWFWLAREPRLNDAGWETNHVSRSAYAAGDQVEEHIIGDWRDTLERRPVPANDNASHHDVAIGRPADE